MNCTICNNSMKDSLSIQIYISYTSHSSTLLETFINKALNCDLSTINHSKHICDKCFNILDDLDYAEVSCKQLREKLYSGWIFKNSDSFVKNVACQTYDLDEKKVIKKLSVAVEDVQKSAENILQNKLINSEFSNEAPSSIKLPEFNNEIIPMKYKIYKCKVCRKQYLSKNGLFLHINQNHKCNEIPENIPENLNDDPPENLIDDPPENLVDDPPEMKVNVEIKEQTTNLLAFNSKIMGESYKPPASSTFDLNKPKSKKKTDCTVVKPFKFPCTICPKKWRTMGELKNHMHSHSPLRPYICEKCGRAYKHKAALDIHVGMHNGINPFTCQFCNKSFTQKGALQRHLPIHTGETPFQCDQCGKRFVHHTSFNMHILAHTGQKAFKCEICGMALLSASHLKRHKRVHTGERPFACSYCNLRFAERYNLASHERLHQSGPSKLRKGPFICSLCNLSFDRKPKLEDHLSNAHFKIPDKEHTENEPNKVKRVYIFD